jgi:hypothetical protein
MCCGTPGAIVMPILNKKRWKPGRLATIAAQPAMKFLAPVARQSLKDCKRMTPK